MKANAFGPMNYIVSLAYIRCNYGRQCLFHVLSKQWPSSRLGCWLIRCVNTNLSAEDE